MPISDREVADLAPPYGFLRTFLRYSHRSTDAPLVYALNTGLAILSGIAPDMSIPMYGSRVYSTWYGLSVASSGARKTHTMSLGENLLREVWDKRLGVQPSSPEGLMAQLQRKPQQLIVWSDFGAFLAHTGPQRAYAAPLRELVISAWDCRGIEYAKAKTTVRVRDPRLSILSAVTPAQLSAHTSVTDWTGGFMSRFATFAAQRTRLLTRSGNTGDLYPKLIELLQARKSVAEPGLIGQCGGMTPRATALWDEWVREIDGRFKSDAREYAEGAAVRTPTIALKAALLLAFDFGQAGEVGPDGTYFIEEDVLRYAVGIAELHQRSVIEICDTITPTLYAQQRRSVLTIMQSTVDGELPVFTRGQIMARMTPRVSRRIMAELLDSLVEERALFRFELAGAEPLYAASPFPSVADDDLVDPGPNVVPMPGAEERASRPRR